jgi:tRNA modification GTPase
LVVVDAKNLDFTDVLKGLLDENAILVINKSDLLEGDIDPEIKKLDHVLISIKKNLNIDELISKIKNNLKNKFITSDDILITRERHRQHLEQCLEPSQKF